MTGTKEMCKFRRKMVYPWPTAHVSMAYGACSQGLGHMQPRLRIHASMAYATCIHDLRHMLP